MAISEVTYYQVKCDCCGVVCDDYGGFSAWSDPGAASDHLPEDWRVIYKGKPGAVEDLCPECWCWPEDHPDHLGDAEWTESGDEVRKHVEHPQTQISRLGVMGDG